MSDTSDPAEGGILTTSARVGFLNRFDGVTLYRDSNGNLIGGPVAGAGNLVTGNGGPGSWKASPAPAASTGLVIQVNRVGTNAVGTAALGNVGAGVEIDGRVLGALIGDCAAGEGNLIGGNAYGVRVSQFEGTPDGDRVRFAELQPGDTDRLRRRRKPPRPSSSPVAASSSTGNRTPRPARSPA